jgi:hypothetical protein
LNFLWIQLTEQGQVCGVGVGKFNCTLQGHPLPAYPGQLISFVLIGQDEGICGITSRSNLVCYLVPRAGGGSAWQLYDAPDQLTASLTWNSKRLCVTTKSLQVHCTAHFSAQSPLVLQWTELEMPLHTFSMAPNDAFACGTNGRDHIYFVLWGTPNVWYWIIGLLQQVVVTSQGAVYGVATDRTIWSRTGLPKGSTKHERA